MTSQSQNAPPAGPPHAAATTRDYLERLAHDMRTPLGAMAAALELLRTEPSGTALHADALAVLRRQVARLHSLTESVHDFAQTVDR